MRVSNDYVTVEAGGEAAPKPRQEQLGEGRAGSPRTTAFVQPCETHLTLLVPELVS